MGELNFFLNRETLTAGSLQTDNKQTNKQIASQRAPEIFFYVYSPSGDVGARRHALRAWAALLFT